MTLENSIQKLDEWDLSTNIEKMPICGHEGCSPKLYKEAPEKPAELTRCPLCAYALRKIALSKIAVKDQPAFQAIWINHCLSPETSYIFAVLRPFKVDRERDITTILDNSLKFDSDGWRKELSKEGRQYYRQKIFEWFIRRYAWCNAVKAIWGSGIPFPTWINLIYPRFLGGIIIGFLPLVPESSIWRLAEQYGITSPYWPPSTLFLIGATLALVFLYIYNECFKLIQGHRNTIWRALGTLLLGCGYSFGAFRGIYWPMMRGVSDYGNNGNPWLYAPFFCSAALLVGVFLQFFWEEKTITEPL